jgi:hypothetical protein
MPAKKKTAAKAKAKPAAKARKRDVDAGVKTD